MIERFDQIDSQLDALECNVSTIVVGAHRARNAVKYVCQQIVAIVEHEQKRTVWAPAIKQTATNNGSNSNNTNNSSSSTNNNKIN
ncbi:unnamed protein product [Anisakis simplex]|uniref:Usp domain-containing protein n=1 Tax=Anisakis simplex TaxID=6269 RepID=A0A0M3J6L4_ANISI|nr:unnamed protein product [Anisakis simplex]